MKLMKNTLITVSRMIAIGDLFSNGDRDRDRGHALNLYYKLSFIYQVPIQTKLVTYSWISLVHHQDNAWSGFDQDQGRQMLA